MKCRACKSNKLVTFLSLGKTPLANSFLTKKELGKEEPKFPLDVCLCDNCKLVQLTYVVPPGKMFRNYLYITSVSGTGKQHFTEMASSIVSEFRFGRGLAVDIGSNDGTLLQGFRASGLEVVGVEPATNVAKISESRGILTLNDFFGEAAVSTILNRYGNADVVTATNVFAHVNDIESFVKNVYSLLSDDGVFVIEAPYLVDLIEKMAFDTIYHEHLSYFSVAPLVAFFRRLGMEVFKIQRVPIHLGSLRIFVKKKSAHYKVDASVKELLELERRMGLGDIAVYRTFAVNVYKLKDKLVSFLNGFKAEGKSIAAYTAPAKANTLLNFCGIGTEVIDYVVDDTPLKQGLYTPGMHIPVVGREAFDSKLPDYIIILAWNFSPEILAKSMQYAEKGVKFVVPLPEPHVIEYR